MRDDRSQKREQRSSSGSWFMARGSFPPVTSHQPPSTIRYLLFAICYLLSFSFLLSPLYAERPLAARTLTAHFIDVGQGDCIFIQLPNGKNILIDGGPEDEYFDSGKEVVEPYLNNIGIKSIDTVVISHAHRDHIGGLSHIIKNFPVSFVYDSGYAYPSPIYERLLRLINKRNIKYFVAREGVKIQMDPSVEILVLGPPKRLLWDDPNNNSIILRITYKKISFLFTGDLEGDGEDSLVRIFKYGLESNILKVPHHGSKTSSTDDFIDAVNPEVAIIQVGRFNRFRHPHPSVVKRLKDFGCELYRNDADGTIVVRTDGESYKVEKLGFK